SRGRAESFRAGEGGGAGQAQRHVGHQGDAAFRRGAAQGRARPDGRGFLGLRRRAQPQDAGSVPASSPRAGTVTAPAHGRGAVPPLDLRDVQGVTLGMMHPYRIERSGWSPLYNPSTIFRRSKLMQLKNGSTNTTDMPSGGMTPEGWAL